MRPVRVLREAGVLLGEPLMAIDLTVRVQGPECRGIQVLGRPLEGDRLPSSGLS